MTLQNALVSTDRLTGDLHVRERVLNAAIAHAEISEGFEEYLEIFDAFYADDIVVSSDTREAPIRGKANVRSFLFNFLVPLHVMAETGGLSVAIREMPIPGDVADETHSAWTLDLIGLSGATCTLRWCTLRRWNGSRVVYEHHYDHEQHGGPLGFEDLNLSGAVPSSGVRRLS